MKSPEFVDRVYKAVSEMVPEKDEDSQLRFVPQEDTSDGFLFEKTSLNKKPQPLAYANFSSERIIPLAVSAEFHEGAKIKNIR